MKTKLTELIERKSFNELTKEEQNFVLSEISEQEFNEKHELISQVKGELKSEASQLKAKDSIHLNALAALREKKDRESVEESDKEKGGAGFFAFKIPLWTAIAAVFMIFILSTPIFINSEFDQNKNDELLALVDTVYVDKIIRDTIEITQPADTVVKMIYTSRDASDEITELPATIESLDIKVNETSGEIIQYNSQSSMSMGSYTSTFDFKSSDTGESLSEDKIGRVLLRIE
ncbi:hypothetical protein [Brumimicrobium mesophilum]|uniref:hypothetical protein n=1 Tax=Brumimicrobium mesophilum TaxID=392717 RepID=UPI000D13F820|nr:hypothetical protein [Brumimicrobium mesophilum]